MGRAEARRSVLLGSAGSLPAVSRSLPNTIFVGKLPTYAGWQPALPGITTHFLSRPNTALALQSR
jgi:hypothetical protein